MFPDDINLFFSSMNIKYLFETMNTELLKLSGWLKANEIAINIDKTKPIFFKLLRERKICC